MTFDVVTDDGVVPVAQWAAGHGAAIPEQASQRKGRTAVLAYGSNASPLQLARKFPAADFKDEDALIPVVRGTLADFDVVYAAHISSCESVIACPPSC